MLTFAVALKDKGVPVPEIAKKLAIKVGKDAGKSPSVASHRALPEAEAASVDDGLPLRPNLARIRRLEDPLTAEEIDLRERLQAQDYRDPLTPATARPDHESAPRAPPADPEGSLPGHDPGLPVHCHRRSPDQHRP
ncbi:hypothetical protein ACIBQX_43680 [Nonomuraea sp. NPDC049714]|uniref:hypothetical protein n=1 Tax=Nonomuraea sp. NPDC049714 TaxID=3364357 RepID=UPI0037A036B6